MTKKPSAFSLIFAILSPLIVLLAAVFFASIMAYLAVLVFGDDISFRTVFKKFTQVFLVFSILPLMKWMKLSSMDLGFASYPLIFKQFRQGICLGLIALLPVLTVLYGFGVHGVDEAKPWTLGWLGKRLALDGLLALLIAAVEEPLFRGILLAGLRKTLPIAWAIAISAFYYAGLHFVNSNIEIPAQDAGLMSGFLLLGDAFSGLFNRNYLSPFISLFVVGVFLGLLRTQTKTGLGLCIGCHACWVWQIKLSKSFFNLNPKSDYLFLVSSYDGVIGPLVAVWLGLAIVAFLLYQSRRTT